MKNMAFYFIFFIGLFIVPTKAIFSNVTLEKIYDMSVLPNEYLPNQTILLVVTNNQTDEFANYQIASIKDKTYLAQRLVTVPMDETAMQKCQERDFGYCAKTHFISFDEKYSVFPLIESMLIYNITVMYFAPTVVIFDIPYIPYEENSADMVVQSKYENGTGIDFSQSVFFPTNTSMMIASEMFYRMEASNELNLSPEDIFSKLFYSENSNVALYEKDMWNGCWNTDARVEEFRILNNYTINVGCRNKEETLEVMKFLTTYIENKKVEL